MLDVWEIRLKQIQKFTVLSTLFHLISFDMPAAPHPAATTPLELGRYLPAAIICEPTSFRPKDIRNPVQVVPANVFGNSLRFRFSMSKWVIYREIICFSCCMKDRTVHYHSQRESYFGWFEGTGRPVPLYHTPIHFTWFAVRAVGWKHVGFNINCLERVVGNLVTKPGHRNSNLPPPVLCLLSEWDLKGCGRDWKTFTVLAKYRRLWYFYGIDLDSGPFEGDNKSPNGISNFI